MADFSSGRVDKVSPRSERSFGADTRSRRGNKSPPYGVVSSSPLGEGDMAAFAPPASFPFGGPELARPPSLPRLASRPSSEDLPGSPQKWDSLETLPSPASDRDAPLSPGWSGAPYSSGTVPLLLGHRRSSTEAPQRVDRPGTAEAPGVRKNGRREVGLRLSNLPPPAPGLGSWPAAAVPPVGAPKSLTLPRLLQARQQQPPARGRAAMATPPLPPESFALDIFGTSAQSLLRTGSAGNGAALREEPQEFPFPQKKRFTGRVFGIPTNFRPLWLIALGSTGNALYGFGTVILERSLWPQGGKGLPALGGGPAPMQNASATASLLVPAPGSLATPMSAAAGNLTGTVAGLVTAAAKQLQNHSAPPHPPVNATMGPGFAGPIGSMQLSKALGGTLVTLGFSAAATAAALLYADNRALVRRAHIKKPTPGGPHYFWPSFYVSAHFFGIGAFLVSRLFSEYAHDHRSEGWMWFAVAFGTVGSMIFSVTQAQSASGSELYYGKMPLWHRNYLLRVASAGVSFFCLFGAMAGTPNFNPYLREFVRLLAVTSFTMMCLLPLSDARALAARRPSTAPLNDGDSWTPVKRQAAWLASRILIGFGPTLWERGYYSWRYRDAAPDAGGQGINRHGYDVAGEHEVVDMTLGAVLAAVGACADLWATYTMRQDARKAGMPYWSANSLWAGATLGTVCLIIYRGIIELAKDRLAEGELWLSTFPGFAGMALHFVCVPQLFTQAELCHGNLPFPQRDRLTKIARCIAGLSFALWGYFAAITGFNPFLREGMFILASMFICLAVALPSTTTRRGESQFTFPQTPRFAPTPPAAMG